MRYYSVTLHTFEPTAFAPIKRHSDIADMYLSIESPALGTMHGALYGLGISTFCFVHFDRSQRYRHVIKRKARCGQSSKFDFDLLKRLSSEHLHQTSPSLARQADMQTLVTLRLGTTTPAFRNRLTLGALTGYR